MLTDEEIERIFDWADEYDIKGREKQPRNSKWGINVPDDKPVVRPGIPRTKEELLQLTHLNLKNSGLSNLPIELFKLTNLVSLDLTRNHFVDLPNDISNLEKLLKLSLKDCNFVSLPSVIGDLVTLENLNLSKCIFLESLPSEIGNLINLKSLDLHSCEKLKSLPDEIGNLRNLKELDLSRNKSLKTLPSKIGKLLSLINLDLYAWSKLESLPKEIGNLINLEKLNLHSCDRLEFLPKEIGNLINLEKLDLHSCDRLEFLPKEIGNLINLEKLDLHSCDRLELLPKEIDGLIGLKKLNLSWCQELKELPKEIGQLTNLIHLDLNYSRNFQKIPKEIGNLHKLEYLDFNYCQMLQSIPKEIGQLINLKYLNLDNCESLEPLPKEIGNLVNLEKFIVSGKTLFTNYDFSQRSTSLNKKVLFSDNPFGSLEFSIKNLLLKGVPGTGKSRAIENIINKKLELKDHTQNVLRINIHSASSNADLMQGIGISSNGGKIEYKEKQGLILNLIERAIFNPNQPFVLILEEIQENSLNELIGDLIYLIEESKRAKNIVADDEAYAYQELIERIITDNPETAYVEIPYLVNDSTEYRKMIMPDNLYIFCTSNYRDDKKVIEDNLLRRFEVLEIYPKVEVVHKYCREFFEQLNENILTKLEDEIHPDRFLIGHSNWLKVNNQESFYRAFLKVVVEFKDIKEVEFSDFKEIVEKLPFVDELNLSSYKVLIEDLQLNAGYDFLD